VYAVLELFVWSTSVILIQSYINIMILLISIDSFKPAYYYSFASLLVIYFWVTNLWLSF
jgi:hypothetical protein